MHYVQLSLKSHSLKVTLYNWIRINHPLGDLLIDKSRGAEEAGGAAGTCTDREYIQSQTKFQSCSHAVSTQIYQTFQQVTG